MEGCVDRFYSDFSLKLTAAKDLSTGMRQNTPSDTNIECSVCGRHMMIRTAGTGVFCCLGYALPPKERCKLCRLI